MSGTEQNKTAAAGNDTSNELSGQKNAAIAGRRKFLKGAAAATPILMSVSSRPVWARNCSLSGQLSGNLSDQDGQACEGEGCSKGYWGQRGYQVGGWHPQFDPKRPFNEVFGRDAFPGKTLYDVVTMRCGAYAIKPASGCGLDDLITSSIDYSANSSLIGSKSKPSGDKLTKCQIALLDLGAQAVAALLNAASPLRFDLEVGQVIQSFQAAYDAGTPSAMEETKTALDDLNSKQHCPL